MRCGFVSVFCGLLTILGLDSIAAEPLLKSTGLIYLQANSDPSHPDAVIVATNTGQKTTGILKNWSLDKIVVAAAKDQEFAISDLRSIIFDHPVTNRPSAVSTVLLSNGDRISAAILGTASESLSISWPILREDASRKIPLEHVVAMILEWPATSNEQHRLSADIATLPSGSDTVMFKGGDRSQGEFERLDSAFAELKGNAGSLKLDRSRVRAIRLNPELTMSPRLLNRRIIMSLIDGSRVTATSVVRIQDRLTLVTPELGEVTIPMIAVAECRIFGETSIPISDFEPSKIEFTPYLSASWKLVRNANVRHGALKLREREFTSGLGMHSRMAVTYELRGNELEFQGIVGIDDIAGGAGSAIFTVDLDGKRVWTSPEITGKSLAASLPSISVQGGKQLTLMVDFGQYADVSDYADWCDAVLIVDPARAATKSLPNRKPVEAQISK